MLKRYRVLAVVLIVCMVSMMGRIFFISYFQSESVTALKNSAIENYGTNRALIFDRNMHSLVENETVKQTAVCDNSFVFQVPKRYADTQLCEHIIGYTNYENQGVSGIEKDYDDFLKSFPNYISIQTFKDAKGNKLLGKGTRIIDENRCTNTGVVLSIDTSIQNIVQTAGKKLNKGAVIVMQADTGDVLASSSFPGFNPNSVDKYLSDENNRPFINRSFEKYNVGSVFKVIICLAALEKGIGIEQKYTCNGKIMCGDVLFHCHKKEGHGTINMKQALAFSCNTYFIQLAQKIGYQPILDVCKRLSIEKDCVFSESLVAKGGTIPSAENLSSPAALANFSFGQGELLTSPIWLCSLYSAIFNGGYYCIPQLVESTVIEGKKTKINNHTKMQVIDKSVAYTLLKMLRFAVTDGTGKSAASGKFAVAGKTATAQTGFYDKNQEKLISYFIGLFSIKGEKYTVLVMKEGGTSGSADCAPIFKEICESIYDIKMKGNEK